MNSVDISILQKVPVLDSRAILEIRPLAPLSMVRELPGSYYKTLKMPDKKMLCGLFENILGWHIDWADRKMILKELGGLRKKQSKKDPNLKFSDQTKGSTFIPLLMDYFEVEKCVPKVKKVVFYDDLWKKAYRRADADVHPKGTTNLSYELISDKRALPRDDKKPKQLENRALFEFFREHVEQFPLYYSTPTKREYVAIDGVYSIEVNIDAEFKKMLHEKIEVENIGYLGNNEGWVDLKFNDL